MIVLDLLLQKADYNANMPNNQVGRMFCNYHMLVCGKRTKIWPLRVKVEGRFYVFSITKNWDEILSMLKCCFYKVKKTHYKSLWH